MRKSRTSSNTPTRLLTRLMMPNLVQLSSKELIDLFICTAKQFEQGMICNAAMEELNILQAQIATIKDHIYAKSSLSPEGTLSNGYFYSSFINKN